MGLMPTAKPQHEGCCTRCVATYTPPTTPTDGGEAALALCGAWRPTRHGAAGASGLCSCKQQLQYLREEKTKVGTRHANQNLPKGLFRGASYLFIFLKKCESRV
jgi:hypothetical protein